MANEKKIEVELGGGKLLMVEVSTDPNFSKEIYIGVTDRYGVWKQDLAVVRQHIKPVNDLGEKYPQFVDGQFDVLVYTDENFEDYTHNFVIHEYDPDDKDSVTD